jgi:membrane protein DedA with SNARE-associated domain
MSFEQLIADYGYLAILVVTFIEGESIVILGGLAVHLGYGLELQWVIASAVAGSFSGDQCWYYVGRHWGPKIIARRLSWQEGAAKVYAHLHRHQYWLILTFRFYYGLRNVTPFVVGSAHVPRLRFFALNLIGALVWAVAFAYVGYFLGEASKLFIADFKRYGLYVFLAVVAAGFLVWVFVLLRHRRKAQERGLK